MNRHEFVRANRGFFAIGIINGKTANNLGTLWRSAVLYDAAFVFTVGKRYVDRQASDTVHAAARLPLFHFGDVDDLVEHLPVGCPLVGIELDDTAMPLSRFTHPERAAYLLGAEDHGLRPADAQRCHGLIRIESVLPWSMNVAVAGTLVMYDRFCKGQRVLATTPVSPASRACVG